MADDFDDFAQLWREGLDPQEAEKARRTAERTTRRARLIGWAELAVAAVIAAGAVAALMMDRKPLTLVSAGLLLVALLWSVRRRLHLRRIAASVLEGDGGSVVQRQILRARADLRRARLGLWLYPPGLLLGHMLVSSFTDGTVASLYWERVVSDFAKWPHGPLALLFFFGLIGYQLRTIRKLLTELTQLETIRDQYREEAKMEELGSP